MLIWSSKYALTSGIFCHEEEKPFYGYEFDLNKGTHVGNLWHYPGEWHLDRKECIEAANKKKQKKIASLQKQVRTLEQISFVRQAESPNVNQVPLK